MIELESCYIYHLLLKNLHIKKKNYNMYQCVQIFSYSFISSGSLFKSIEELYMNNFFIEFVLGLTTARLLFAEDLKFLL